MRYLAAAGLALALAAVAGCTPAEKAEIQEDVRGLRQQVDQATEGAQRAAARAALESRVKTALLSRKNLDADHIDVEALDSTIILKGIVPNAEQAEIAERIALETKGVPAVDNQLSMQVPIRPGTVTAPPEGTTGSDL